MTSHELESELADRTLIVTDDDGVPFMHLITLGTHFIPAVAQALADVELPEQIRVVVEGLQTQGIGLAVKTRIEVVTDDEALGEAVLSRIAKAATGISGNN